MPKKEPETRACNAQWGQCPQLPNPGGGFYPHRCDVMGSHITHSCGHCGASSR
jgi:hypothetical protein